VTTVSEPALALESPAAVEPAVTVEPAVAPWLHSGDGTLARYRGVTLLVGPGDELVTGQLLAAARAAADAGEPDLRLQQIATRLIAANGKAPALCAVGEVAGGVAALVHGTARITVRTEHGALSLSGCESVAVVDGFLAGQVSLVEADLGRTEVVEPPGDAVRLHVVPRDAGPADDDARQLAEPAEPAVESEPMSVPPPVAAAENVVSAIADAVTAIEETAEEIRAGVAAITGVRCRKGHFNDPNLAYCVVCGLGLTQSGRVPAQAERPVLGVLLLDDGRLLPLDRDHVLGRAPELSDQVRSGEAAAIQLEDALVSEVHAWISLRGWEVHVTDLGSQHGTYLRNPGSADWEPLHGGSQQALQPGALIAIGARQLRFETYRK